MCGRRDDSLLLDDMADAAQRILELGAGVPFGVLGQDRNTAEMILWNLLVLGEASKRISEATRTRFSDIEWRLVAGTRDRVSHHYEGVDWQIVTSVIADDLPAMLPRLIEIRDVVRAEFDAQG